MCQDMAPYVPLIMPELQSALIDPLPEVRATAARALGSLLRSMGDDLAKSVMPWLLQTLKSDVSLIWRQLCPSTNLLSLLCIALPVGAGACDSGQYMCSSMQPT